jgi:CRP-like cAMP-binding protein
MEGSRERSPRTHADYTAALASAVAHSALSRFPPAVRTKLVARGTRLDVPARAIVYRDLDEPRSGVIVSGTIRGYATSIDGREFTVFWAHAGEWIGFDLIVGGPSQLSGQAVTDVTLHLLPTELLTSLARSDAAMTWEIARECSRRGRQALEWLRMLAFVDLRGRIAHRLLELAFHQPSGMPLIAELTQQDLADSVGSPRSSVARILGDLRREGIVRSVPRGILVVRPERLVPGPRPLRAA